MYNLFVCSYNKCIDNENNINHDMQLLLILIKIDSKQKIYGFFKVAKNENELKKNIYIYLINMSKLQISIKIINFYCNKYDSPNYSSNISILNRQKRI